MNCDRAGQERVSQEANTFGTSFGLAAGTGFTGQAPRNFAATFSTL